MSFDFVPRSVKKRKVEPSVSTPTTITRKNVNSANKTDQNIVKPEQKSSSKDHALLASASNAPIIKAASNPSSKEPDLEALAALVCLALSDYALWADVDLRRRIDWSSTGHDSDVPNDEAADDNVLNETGFVPLAYLFKHSSVFCQATASPSFHQYPETTYVKALRIHATEFINVRLTLSSEEPAFGQTTTGKWSQNQITQTGYEVRRNALNVAEKNNLSGHGKVDWDKLTIYVENIPIQYRNLPGALKFITNILSSAPSPSNLHFRVQHVTFPPHHRDQPNSVPVCKGFAIVTLSSSQDVNHLLGKWPWDSQKVTSDLKAAEVQCSHPEVLQDASKFGFRTLNKQNWDALKAEYLLFRQQLVEEINEFQEQDTVQRHVSMTIPPPKAISKSNHPVHTSPRETCVLKNDTTPTTSSQIVAEASSGPPNIRADSAYPSGCLVFVRYLHLETNKTTLRALFSQAWKPVGVQNSGSKPVDGIDYLDYMKGTDCCHIRLSTPLHAQQFVDHFSAHSTEQTSGLDGVGQATDHSQKAIIVEPVLGKREELYWQKVPEKIRRQAVDKAIKLMNASNAVEDSGSRLGIQKRKRR